MGFIHISRENAGIVGLYRLAGASAGGMVGKRLDGCRKIEKGPQDRQSTRQQDREMEHAIITQAQAVAYRVTQAGILACLYYRLLIKGQAAMELCALLVVSGMVEAAIMLVQTFRKAKDDEEHPPRLTFLIAKLMFCAVLIGLAIGMTVLTQNW